MDVILEAGNKTKEFKFFENYKICLRLSQTFEK